jgi:hypothetical protein
MRFEDGRPGLLEIHGRPEGLEIRLTGPEPSTCDRRLALRVTCDRQGRACARDVGARVMPDTSDARELEHFLRRIVRAVFAAT